MQYTIKIRIHPENTSFTLTTDDLRKTLLEIVQNIESCTRVYATSTESQIAYEAIAIWQHTIPNPEKAPPGL